MYFVALSGIAGPVFWEASFDATAADLATLDAGGPGPGSGSCGRYGTQVEFVGTPSEAAAMARKQQKLVFVLHLSGHFEDPRFT
jgi:hypothetical protein